MENNNNIPEMKVGLSREKTIPVIGFGTSTFPLISSETTKEAILGAIKHGYRHFDTAAIYQTELPLGDAISEAISLGFIQSRTQLFVTSKLWCTQAHHHLVLPAIQQTLRNLRLDYLDLYLIHWPIAIKPGEFLNFKKEDFLVMDFKSVWESMEECQNLGLTKSIGVSNFSCKKLETLLATAKIPPEFLHWKTAQINFAYRTVIDLLIRELLIYARSANFGDSFPEAFQFLLPLLCNLSPRSTPASESESHNRVTSACRLVRDPPPPAFVDAV